MPKKTLRQLLWEEPTPAADCIPKFKPRRVVGQYLLRMSPGTSVVIRSVFTHAASEKSPVPSARFSLCGTVIPAPRPSNKAAPGPPPSGSGAEYASPPSLRP